METSRRQLSWSGVSSVARLELRGRLRSEGWHFVLMSWVVVVVILALATSGDRGGAWAGFSFLAFGFYLVLAVAPAITATSLNRYCLPPSAGDSLARLSPSEILLGALGAVWTWSLILVATTLPAASWVLTDKAVESVSLMSALVYQLLVFLFFGTLGLCWSAILAQPWAAVCATYLTGGFLALDAWRSDAIPFGLPLEVAFHLALGALLIVMAVRRLGARLAVAASPSPGLAPDPADA